MVTGGQLMAQLAALPTAYEAGAKAEDLHIHRAIVFLVAGARYCDDVAAGEALPNMAKKPMTVTGLIADAQGWGGLYIRANKPAFRQIRNHHALLARARVLWARVLWAHQMRLILNRNNNSR